MKYIYSPLPIEELSKITWSCDKYGNWTDDTTEYTKFCEEVDPFILTEDKEEFACLVGFINFLYPENHMYTYTLKNREFSKIFNICWYNFNRLFHSKKYSEIEQRDLEERYYGRVYLHSNDTECSKENG